MHLVGCVREAAAKLTSTMFPLLSALAIQFAAHEVSIYENDSADKTRDVLLQWLSQPSGGIHARSLMLPLSGEIASRYPERTDRIAHCRNTLMRHALQRSRRWHGKTASAFVVVLDLDCKRPVAPTPLAMAVMSMLRSREWDVLAGNSKPGHDYYDLWALRSKTLGMEYDCWRDRQAMARFGSCDAYEMRLDQKAPPFEVDSAFNGLAIYRVSSLLRKERRKENHKKWWQQYLDRWPSVAAAMAGGSGSDSAAPCMYDGRATCEHVPFHACLRRRGLRLGVAPYLTQGCGNGAPRPPPPSVVVRMQMNGSVEVAQRWSHNETVDRHYYGQYVERGASRVCSNGSCGSSRVDVWSVAKSCEAAADGDGVAYLRRRSLCALSYAALPAALLTAPIIMIITPHNNTQRICSTSASQAIPTFRLMSQTAPICWSWRWSRHRPRTTNSNTTLTRTPIGSRAGPWFSVRASAATMDGTRS